MRSGFPLFESWLGYDSHVLEEMVRILGKPPESWWSAFDERGIAVTKVEGPSQHSLVDQVGDIGAEDEPPLKGEAPTRPWIRTTRYQTISRGSTLPCGSATKDSKLQARRTFASRGNSKAQMVH